MAGMPTAMKKVGVPFSINIRIFILNYLMTGNISVLQANFCLLCDNFSFGTKIVSGGVGVAVIFKDGFYDVKM